MNQRTLVLMAGGVLLASCGGSPSTSSVPPGSPTEADRVAAASATAENNPKCSSGAIGSFYWEIGDANGVRASGSVGVAAPQAGTPMRYFSASKWLYAAYVAQRRGLRDDDAPFMNFTAGYTQYENDLCPLADTVAQCLMPGQQNAAAVGKYFYASGHMQIHASEVMNLGSAGKSTLEAELAAAIGIAGIDYDTPQLAAGAYGTAATYGAFLRRLLRGDLALASGLGRNKVCTNAATCNTALSTPIPSSESWNYSWGHWVEDDPRYGDRAFSSAGGGGFYPWIDSTKTLYGIVARERLTESDAGYHSAECGRLIRQAWRTGVEVTASTPTP